MDIARVDQHTREPDMWALGVEHCFELLRESEVGRIGFLDPAGSPVVLPVTVAVAGDAVLLRTAPGSALATIPAGAPVCLEVDDLDRRTRTGWSVVLRGTLHDDAPDLGGMPLLQPWAPGERSVRRAIRSTSVTGRQIRPGADGDWSLGAAAYM